MKRFGELSLLAALGLGLAAVWSQFALWASDPLNGYPQLIAGTAQRPYVYRALPVLLVRGLMLAGVELYAAGAVVVAASFILWLWSMRWLAGLVGVPRPLLATVLAVGPVCILFVAGGYLYDPLTLALLTLGLALMAAERWRAYLVFFPLMALTRESA